MMMRPPLLVLAALAMLGLARSGETKLCGDAVDGQDVPCACGDVVASDVVLGPSDPVTQAACPDDGLTVRAPQATTGVTVDLHGETLRGSGHGAGLLLLDGQARVVSTAGPATVTGFQDGIFAHGDTAVALIADVVVSGSRRDGVRLESPGFEVRDTTVRDAGRDGFGLAGKGYRVTRTRAEGSRRHGYAVWGNDGIVTDALAVGSGATGFDLMGMGHALATCTARGGGGDGLKLWGMHFWITGCTASDNAGDGIEGMGMDWRLAGNVATDNGGDGLHVYGYALLDDGGNRGSGNRGLGKRRDPEQCEIAEQDCRP
jgi:parallel beta helix pectate lyase-like protein